MVPFILYGITTIIGAYSFVPWQLFCDEAIYNNIQTYNINIKIGTERPTHLFYNRKCQFIYYFILY